jgi:hypothetical protein
LHSAAGWDYVLKPVVSRYPGKVSRTYFCADAGFANPKVEAYNHLEAGGRMRSDQQQVDNRDDPFRRAPM